MYEYNKFYNNIYIPDTVFRSKTGLLIFFLCMEGIENKKQECLMEELIITVLYSLIDYEERNQKERRDLRSTIGL